MARKKTHKELIVTLRKHHKESDEKFEGPYYNSEVIINDKLYATLGAYNEDLDPDSFFSGFVEALSYLDKNKIIKLEDFQIIYEHKADYNGK